MLPFPENPASEAVPFRELLDNIPVGIGVAGPVEADGMVLQESSIIYYNKEWVRMFGFDAREVRTVAQATQRLYPVPEIRQEMIRLRKEAAERRLQGLTQDTEQMEARAMGRDGQWREVLSGTSVINGQMIVTMLDITDQKQAERSLAAALEAEREARAAAERAVHAKSLFLASVSHEIRTPLSALISLAQAMSLESEKHQLPPEFVTFLEHVRSGGNYLNLILTNLLDVAALDSAHPRLHDDSFYLLDWVQDLQNILMPISRSHGITLAWELPADGEIRLRTDQTRLTQILLNLAHNAVKFSGGSGRTVRISVTCDRTQGTSFAVSDEGPGIPPERLPGLFGEFVQSETQGPAHDRGIGLGLAVVKKNADLLGGVVHAENLAPCGMRFTVSFPQLFPL